MSSALSQEDLLKPHPNPFNGETVVWDTMECYSDQDDYVNRISSIGFEPYAVTLEMDRREEVLAKAKIQNTGIPVRNKMWFKRPRLVKESQ